MALADDESAMVSDNMGLVLKLLSPMLNTRLSRIRDDLIQEGAIGLLRAIRSYDKNRGTRLSTHAWWLIRRQIQTRLRHEAKHTRETTSSFSEAKLHPATPPCMLLDQLADRDMVARVEKVVASLSETTQKYIRPYLEGRRLAEIARDCGVSRETVRKLVRRGIEVIRKELAHE